ncbi:MAG: hypothetical protein C4308_14985, partial [Chitinophagaceae bacterium]
EATELLKKINELVKKFSELRKSNNEKLNGYTVTVAASFLDEDDTIKYYCNAIGTGEYIENIHADLMINDKDYFEVSSRAYEMAYNTRKTN